MRTALALVAAAALLAACRVEVEGAACRSDDECPSRQRCGNDARCSSRAAACADPCRPAAEGTAPNLRCAPTRTAVEECEAADPICGRWTLREDCGAYDCDPAVAEPACRCPAPGSVVWVDPALGGTDAGHPPTGAAAPPACRLGTLGAALALAGSLGAGAVVRPVPAVLGAGEVFPVRVPAGVTLRGADDAAQAGAFVLRRDAATATNPVLRLERGAAVEGLTVASTIATAPVVDLDCTGDGPSAAIRASSIDGGGAASAGILVGGTCGLDLADVAVRANEGAGLQVRPSDPTAVVSVARGSFETSGPGIWMDAGTLSVSGDDAAPVVVQSNHGHGVFATKRGVPAPPHLELELSRVLVADNAETGVALESLPLVAGAVSIVNVEIRSNRATTTASGFGTLGRKAGGLVLRGDPPATFTFHGNLVRGNEGDEVGIVSATTWHLSGAACDDGTKNVFTCAGTDAYAIVSEGSQASARNDGWDVTWPGSIVAGADVVPYCTTPGAPPPPCP